MVASPSTAERYPPLAPATAFSVVTLPSTVVKFTPRAVILILLASVPMATTSSSDGLMPPTLLRPIVIARLHLLMPSRIFTSMAPLRLMLARILVLAASMARHSRQTQPPILSPSVRASLAAPSLLTETKLSPTSAWSSMPPQKPEKCSHRSLIPTAVPLRTSLSRLMSMPSQCPTPTPMSPSMLPLRPSSPRLVRLTMPLSPPPSLLYPTILQRRSISLTISLKAATMYPLATKPRTSPST